MGAFGDRLIFAMEKAGFSKTDLARRIGVVQSRMTDLVNMDDIPPAMKTVVDASQVLGVSLDWLLLGKESDPSDLVARKIRQLPEDQQRLLEAQVDTWLAMARQESRKTSG
jgi:transcriptional regulator with XRE-family HTH domain